MTKKELIEALAPYDDDIEVEALKNDDFPLTENGWYSEPITEIKAGKLNGKDVLYID